VEQRKKVFLENVSPAHNRRPAPKGKEKSFLVEKFPLKSKNLSGLKFSGSFQSSLSLFKENKFVIPKEFFGIS